MFFKSEYNEYYDVLSNNDGSMHTAVIGLQDSFTEVTNQFSSVSSLLGELQGEFTKEMNQGISSLITEMNGLKKIIETDLPEAESHMNSLGDKLLELKPDDEKYEETVEEIQYQKNIKPNQYKIDDAGQTRQTMEYNNWINNLERLNKALNELEKICIELQTGCDRDIGLIEEFNQKIVELRLKLVAIATSTGTDTIKDVESMTYEEKKEYLENLIITITEKFNEYKKLYDYYSKNYIIEELNKNPIDGVSTDDRLLNFTEIYFELLGLDIGKDKDKLSLYNVLRSDNPVTRGNGIVTIIEMLTNPENGYGGKSVLDIVDSYAKSGSWTESGMAHLYRKRIDDDSILREAVDYWGEDPEELFWSRATFGEYEEYNQGIVDDFDVVARVLNTSKENFNENYDKALGNAMIIKGVRGLKDCLDYDCTYKSEDYKDYVYNSDILFINGFDEDRYSLTERKMISYLLETKSYEAAKEYENLRLDAINRRNGQINARNYYDNLHNGSNEGLDSVLDHIGVGAKGFGDGLSTFADGLIDLVAPDKVMSEHDYETMYFLRELEESNDGYDKSLLTDYRITNKIGTYTIPTVVGALTGGSGGTALFIASDIGNGIESQQQMSYQATQSYDSLVLEQESYFESLYNTATSYVETDLPNDVASAVVGIFKELNPIAGAVLDVAFDEVYKPLVSEKNS